MLYARNDRTPTLGVQHIEGTPTNGCFTVKPLLRGDAMALMEIRLEAGASSSLHAHDHESMLYVVRGRLETTVADETFVLSAGDVCRHPRGVMHRVAALEDTVFVEVKSPAADLGALFGGAESRA